MARPQLSSASARRWLARPRAQALGFTVLGDWRSRRRLLVAKLRKALGLELPAELGLTVKHLGPEPFVVRPGTTDLGTLVHDIAGEEHMPPLRDVELRAIVELGSNIGTGVAALAARYPRARVVGVEPDPANAALARGNLARFGDRCELVERAIWDRPGVLRIEGEAPSGYLTRPVDTAEGPGAAAERTVEAITVESLLAELGLAEVDYLILNLEGAEDRVLAAAVDWAPRVSMLRTELHPATGFDGRRCTELLTSLGFRAWAEEEWWGGWGFGVRGALRARR